MLRLNDKDDLETYNYKLNRAASIILGINSVTGGTSARQINKKGHK